ncbi:toll-like receptor 13 [Hoplias malabaricus]|uniref:toll-like receptor 13 n=1 Tax=Hoplias malabaricus TaxID=27720 RepID=UPI00346261E2
MFVVLGLLCLSLSDVVSATFSKPCFTFEEHLAKDLADVIACEPRPGLGFYADCNISDFHTDLKGVRSLVRSLCIFHSAKVIPQKAFSHLPYLEFLSVYGGQLDRIESDAFLGLPGLKYLKIDFDVSFNCHNVSLEPRAFAGLEHLLELELSGFHFKNIASSTLDPFTGLVNLSLAGVCVKELSDVFCHLSDHMSHLQLLSVVDSGMIAISNQSCMTKSAVLPGITALNLEGNPIQMIENGSLGLFQNLSRLSLSFQRLITDLEDLCHMITPLSVAALELHEITAKTLSEKSFQTCGRLLKMLNIQRSRIQWIDFGFWERLTLIKSLAMTNMDLKDASFCSSVNGTIWNITSLNLENNSLTDIKSNQFICMPILEQLVLTNNFIETLLPSALNGLPKLRILKLDLNKLKSLNYSDFESLPNLEILLISNNNIFKIEGGTFRNQLHLKEMTLGTMMSHQFHFSLIFYGFPPNLHRLSVDFSPYVAMIVFGNISPLTKHFVLNLNINDMHVINIVDCDNPAFRQVQELALKAKDIMCHNNFWTYFTNLESFEYSGNPEDNYVTYTDISTLHKLRRLRLINLNLSLLPDPGIIFWNLTNLQILELINCRLNFLTKSIFRNLQSLELLRLNISTPLFLVDGIFESLRSLAVVVLDRVDFHCGCENNWLLEWAEDSRQVQVMHLGRQQCIWHNQKRNYFATMERLCQTDVQYVCYLGTAVTIAVLVSASFAYRFLYWPCMVIFFQLRGFLERKIGRKWKRKRQRVRQRENGIEEEQEMKYDAFVSFSSHDESWVFGELAPRLEEQGQPRLRLCLHHRDFEVGKGIVDNISESIYSSRHTVCVLSRRYLHSDWCNLEMQVAMSRLLEEQQHHLILIFLEHISPFELSAYHRLVTVVKYRTYLKWPKELVKQEHFWECLRRNIIMDAP